MLRPGSHMYRLVLLLSVSGEFPCGSLGILGDTRTVKAMLHKMESVQKIKIAADGPVLSTRLFQASGRGGARTVRLYKGALGLLDGLHPDALGYYLTAYPGNRFSGSRPHIERNHRAGEALAMCMMAGIEIAPYMLPRLQKEKARTIRFESGMYYMARNIKSVCKAELNKTIYTRTVGLLLYQGGSYAVYNTRGSAMKWGGSGEQDAQVGLSDIVRMNTVQDDVGSAILFGTDAAIALATMLDTEKNDSRQAAFSRIYPHIHFVPMNEDGIDLLKILTLPDWNEMLLRALFKPEMRIHGFTSVECDAFWNGTRYYSHIDGDIARLSRLYKALPSHPAPFEVLCLPWQSGFLRQYLGSAVVIKQIEMGKVKSALGIE